MEPGATQQHGRGMQCETGEEQQVTNPIIFSKPAPPHENGIDGAQPINRHSEQKKVPVSKPFHNASLPPLERSTQGPKAGCDARSGRAVSSRPYLQRWRKIRSFI